ncbi:MAG: GntR family transcriptional regulator [Sphaerochaetaceae bacterium]|nr:GntR family transcriptional regulator [Sphaerochaetaceae bacterium]
MFELFLFQLIDVRSHDNFFKDKDSHRQTRRRRQSVIYDSKDISKSKYIANALEKAILSNQYKKGELLPSQKELGEQFNASSRSMREAFKSLEAKGLIEVSQGRRAVVKNNNLDQFVESLSMTMFSGAEPDKKLLTDLIQVHITLEVSASRELSRKNERTIIGRALINYVDKMDRIISMIEANSGNNADLEKSFKNIEFDFNSVIVNSNDNMVFKSIYTNLSPQLHNIMDSLNDSTSEKKKKAREYRYLAEAITNGQTDLAVALTLVLTNALNTSFQKVYFNEKGNK